MIARAAAVAALFAVAGCSAHAVEEAPQSPPSPPPRAPAPPASVAAQPKKAFDYPAAPRDGTVDDYHGVKVADPFRPLEDPDAPPTRRWIEAENRLTQSFLGDIPERRAIHQRLEVLYGFERFRLPERRAGRIFYAKSEGLQNQPVLYVMDGEKVAPRVLLDPNPLAPDGTIAVTFWSPSNDGRYVAYGLSNAGSDWVDVHVRDVASARDLPDRIEWTKFTNVAWTKDGAGFFYTRFPEPAAGQARAPTYFNKVYYHVRGTTQDKDVLVYERPDHKDWLFEVEVSDDGRYLVVIVSKSTDEKNLVYVGDLAKRTPPAGAFTELVSTFEAEYEFIGNQGPRLFFRTNRAAPRGRVIAMDVTRPAESEWKELVPESKDPIEHARWTGDRLVLGYLADAHSDVRVFDLGGKYLHSVKLPGIGTARGFSGRQKDPKTYYAYTSFTAPTTIYEYSPATNTSAVFREPKLPFDPSRYETEQVFAASPDGTRLPIFLVHATGSQKDGTAPTYLYGYGGFNIAITPAFDPALIEWLEMGGVYAVATLRGGGEYGKDWHEAGMKQRKQNVFDDFFAAARFLVSSGVTRPDRLAIGGRSNGGLLVGACVTQHPELFGAALPGVGVMDMLRYHRYTIGWAWAEEYGTSDDPKELATLLAYSPLHNVRQGTRYPATLVTTADHDDRVVPAHSFKFAAALQAAQAGDAPVLIRIETRAGHGGGMPTGKLIEEQADRWTFLVKALAFKPPPFTAVERDRSSRNP